MKIQTNSSGTRSIEIKETHLQTIQKYQLLRDLIDSNGYVDEQVLDKLKLNLSSQHEGLRLATARAALHQLEGPWERQPRLYHSGHPGHTI